MTVLELLNQFYSDLILVKRDSEQTAMTYKISVEEFLNFLVKEKIKLRAVSTQDLILFLIKRQKKSPATVKTITGDFLHQKKRLPVIKHIIFVMIFHIIKVCNSTQVIKIHII